MNYGKRENSMPSRCVNIVVSLMIIFCTQQAKAHRPMPTPYYFIAIHCEPLHDVADAKESIEENYAILRQMVKDASELNIKLTLMFSPSWARYIGEDQTRTDEIQAWRTLGHEIGAHHHSIYHGNWDGYTNYPPWLAELQRYEEGRVVPETYLGTLDLFMDSLASLGPIRSGCVNEEEDKVEMPEGIIYSTCSGYANFGSPGRLMSDFDEPLKGRNEYVTVGWWNGALRKWLAHYLMPSVNELHRVREVFADMGPDEAYGVVLHASPKNMAAYYGYLEFVHAEDPLGFKSRTVTEIIEEQLLPERFIEVPQFSE